MTETDNSHVQIHNLLNELGLSVEAEFVPWSKSRFAKEKDPSLNWIVTVMLRGRPVLTTDYTSGCARCPSYRTAVTLRGMSIIEREMLVWECEHGRAAFWVSSLNGPMARPSAFGARGRIEPSILDVVHSLVSDSDAIEHGSYETWADDLGYGQDSRKGEAIYRACLAIGLKLRSSLGNDNLERLREAFRDY